MADKPYRFPLGHKPPIPLTSAGPKIQGAEKEILTHAVQGQKASDLEERFAKALDKVKTFYQFQVVHRYVNSGKEALDFLVFSRGTYYPVQVDDTTFIHKGNDAHDQLVDIHTIMDLKKMGFSPLFPEVRHVTDVELSTQEDADRHVNLYYR